MERWILSFLLGALLSLFLPIVPTYFYVILFSFVTIVCFVIKKVALIGAFFVGLTWIIFFGASYNNIWQDNGLNKLDLANKRHIVEGEVTSIPDGHGRKVGFYFTANVLNGYKLKRPINIKLKWQYTSPKDKTVKKGSSQYNSGPLIEPKLISRATIKQGQYWRLMVKIKPSYGLANPGSFSYQTWLRSKDIHATGYVVNNKENQIQVTQSSLRQSLYNKLKSELAGHPLSPLVLALSFGERSLMDKHHWQVLQSTATHHLMAISGLHLALVALFSYMFISWILKVFPFNLLPEKYKNSLLLKNNHFIILICCFAACSFYSYLAGFAVPTIRAIVFLFLFTLLKLFAIRITLWQIILYSFFIIVICLPSSLLSSSFWLSFYAVAIILSLHWSWPNELNYQKKLSKRFIHSIRHLLKLQTGLTLGMMPISLFLTQKLSLIALFSNIIAVPFMSLLLMPLILLCNVSLFFDLSISQSLLNITLNCFDIMWQFLSYLSEFESLILTTSLYFLVTSLLLLACIVCWRLGIKVYVLLALFFTFNATAFSYFYTSPTLIHTIANNNIQSTRLNPQPWKLHVLDIGQGLSLLVEQNNKFMLYDTGASYFTGFNMVDAAVLPYLRLRGVKQLDFVVISHDDNDHAGGLLNLVNNMPSQNYLGNGKYFTGENSCVAGKSITWQGLTIKVLWPLKANINNKNRAGFLPEGDDNDESCVLIVSDGKRKLLLTGDISSEIEKHLVTMHRESGLLNADIIVAPHHGSKTSSSSTFINAVSPKYVVFSTGYLNRWKMPNKSVLQRYQDSGVKSLNTADSGMVSLEISPDDIHISEYRKHVWPFWFAN